MPYYHCRKCMHEFEYIQMYNEEPICNWCKSDRPIMLEEKTPLERMCEDKAIKKLLGKYLSNSKNGDWSR